MHIQFDPDVNALYVALRPGAVARTIELTDAIYADVDAEGRTLGIEFANADDFIPFLRDHLDDATTPPDVREWFRTPVAR